MSDEQTEQELDAAVIANYRAWCAEFDTIEAADWSFALDLRLEELRVLLGDGSDTFADSAIRTIDRLTAERDAARAEVERLRAVIDDAAAFLSGEAKQLSIESEQGWDDTAAVEYRAESDKLRAALGTEADHDIR